MPASKPSKIAIGYIRVSTVRQAEEGVSLGVQQDKIAAYCAAHGLELLTIESDNGVSGRKAKNRPGLQRALKLVKQRKAALVVYSLSRFARSTRDCVNIAADIKGWHGGLISVTENIDTTSAMGDFFFTLMAALAKLESDMISERTSAGTALIRRTGKRISQTIPYGCDPAGDEVVLATGERKLGTLTANPFEQSVIAEMQQWAAAGTSYNAIAAKLNERGTLPKRGRQWYASSVRSVLHRAQALAA